MDAIFDQGTPPPCPEPFNLAAYVLAHAGRLGDKTALSVIAPDGTESWSYGALESAVLGAATGLRHQGLAPGDRLLMRLGNSVEFPICYLGSSRGRSHPHTDIRAADGGRGRAYRRGRLAGADRGRRRDRRAGEHALPNSERWRFPGTVRLAARAYALGDPEPSRLHHLYVRHVRVAARGHPCASGDLGPADDVGRLVRAHRGRPAAACGVFQLDLYARNRVAGSVVAGRDRARSRRAGLRPTGLAL